MNEKFEATKASSEKAREGEENKIDTPEIEIVSPFGSGGRKISEEELKKSREALDAVDNTKSIKNEIEEIEELRERQSRGELLSQKEIVLLNSKEMTEKETKESEIKQAKEIENKELAEDWENLETAREIYLKEYQEFTRGGRLGRLRNTLGLAPSGKREMPQELKEAKENYDQAKQLYAQDEWENSMSKLSADLSAPERNQAEAEIKNKIFNITVLDEMDYLQEAEAETFPPKQRGVFMKAYDKWSGLSKTKRLIYSTVMIAGVAGFASLAVPVSAGVAAIGMGGVAGRKLLRGTLGMLMAGVAGKTYDKATQGMRGRIEQSATDTAEIARGDFNLDNLSEIEERYQEAIKQEQKGKRNLLFGKVLVMGATGAGSTVGLGLLDNALAGGGVIIESDPNYDTSPLEGTISPKSNLEWGGMDAGVILESDPNYDVSPLVGVVPDELDMSEWSTQKSNNFNDLQEWRKQWGAEDVISDKELENAAELSRQDIITETLEKKVRLRKLHEIAKEIAKEKGTYETYTDENGIIQEKYSTKGLKWSYKDKTWVEGKVNTVGSANSNDSEMYGGLKKWADNQKDLKGMFTDEEIKKVAESINDNGENISEDVSTIPDNEIAEIPDKTSSADVVAVEKIVPTETVSVAEVLNPHSIESGDNLWNILKTKLPEMDDLERAGMKDNAIANLVEKIKENPQDYGITSGNVDNLKIGDEINLEKIQNLLETEKIGNENLIDHAQGLSAENLEKIESYKPETIDNASLSADEAIIKTDEIKVDAIEAEVLAEKEVLPSGVDLPPTTEEIYEQAVKEGEQNMAVKLNEFGGQFMKQEWDILKEMPAEKALEGVEKFESKGFFSRLFSAEKSEPFGVWLKEATGKDYVGNSSDMMEQGNRQQLREYLKQAYEATGKSFQNENIGDYLKRYETNNLASEIRAKNPIIGV